MTDVETLLARTRPADLLPERRADEAERVTLPWTVIAEVPLESRRPDGGSALLLVLQDARGERFGVPALIEGESLRRARAGDGVAEALLASCAGIAAKGLMVETFGEITPLSGERAIDVDQTNDLVVVGESAVVKWYLHPKDGHQPAPERMAVLARAGFDGTPRTWAIVRVETPGSSALAATITEFVPDTQDGWDWAVDAVRTVAHAGDPDGLAWVRDLADLVARMHVAFASAGMDAASMTDVDRWCEQAGADAARWSGELTEADYAAVGEAIESMRACAGTPMVDIHGDLHIGQILRSATSQRLFVVDFDGNPTVTPEQRAARQPAARDVAGMLASLDHVGRVVLHRTSDLDEAGRHRVRQWIEEAQEAFLAAYRASLADAGRVDILDDRLLRPFQIEQEFREYSYAERYLPHWRYVPDAALPALLSRGPA